MINGNATLCFGYGDICVNSATQGDKAFVLFSNQSKREIGSEGEILIGQEVNVNEIPVAMQFDKVESIDVVIKALEIAKIHLLEIKNSPY